MTRKILYIINPIAGTGSFTTIQKRIEQATRRACIPFECIPSNAMGSYQAVGTRITNEQFTDVIIAGGDGTVSQVIGALRHLPIQFGIIPIGSGNGLARAAKIPTSPAAALTHIFEETGKATDGFLVNQQFACMLSGFGFDATVAHAFAKQSTRGLLTYTKEVIKNFSRAIPYFFELSIDGQSISLEAYMISVANANQYGNNFTIAPFASLQDGLLDIIIFPKQHKLSLLWQAGKQLLRLNSPSSISLQKVGTKLIHCQASTVTIKNKEEALLHIDGDPATMQTEVSIQILPQAFRLIRKSN